MDKFFEYEEAEEERKVKYAVTKLKGHATLWWDGVQTKRRRKNVQKIKNWDKMVAKLRGKFLPKGYMPTLFRSIQNIKQRAMTVREYPEEFYKVNIRAQYVEDSAEKIARYINGLKLDIQDEISVLSPTTVEETYQLALKAEEKLARKQTGKEKGAARSRGQQQSRGRSNAPKDGASSSSPQ